MHIGQSPLDAVVIESEAAVVDSQEMQDGGMEVVPVNTLVDGFPADIVRAAVGHAATQSSPGEPHREPVLVVVPSCSERARARLGKGCAAELGREQDQRVVQQATLPQVTEQCGQGAVDAGCLTPVIFDHVLMAIPVDAGTDEGASRKELYKSDSAFDQSPSQQAGTSEIGGAFGGEAVLPLGQGGFAVQVRDDGYGALHSGS